MFTDEDQLLADALQQANILTPDDIEKAKQVQEKFGGAWTLREVLLARRLVDEDQLARVEDGGATAGESSDDSAGTLLLGDEPADGNTPDTLITGEEAGTLITDETAPGGKDEATLIGDPPPVGEDEATLADSPPAGGDDEATLIGDPPPAGDDEATLADAPPAGGDDEATLISGGAGVSEDDPTFVSGDQIAGAPPKGDEESETLITEPSQAATPPPDVDDEDMETMLHVKESLEDAETMMSEGTSAPTEADLDDGATMVTEVKLSPEDESLEDEIFAAICIEMGIATDEEIIAAREKQMDRRKAGEPHRLGALLVDEGVLEHDQVSKILQTQYTRVLACPKCGKRTTATDTSPGTLCACSRCAAEMSVPDGTAEISQIQVKEYLEYKSRGPISVSSVDQAADRSSGAAKMIGTTIGGCKITKKLGEGGMGAVYKGEHETLRRESAIKILPAAYANNPTLVARFFREARAAGKIRHPNIVEVYNVGQDAGLHFIEMEYVKGKSVKQMMDDGDLKKEDGTINLDECIRIMKDTAIGLVAAHTADVIHRDIKPDNIMVNLEGRVKIADFGLARSVEGESMDLTKTGQIMGTPTYISPEQADAAKTDQRTDIYSLGATFYHLVTDEKPFTGDSPMVILLKHINEEPTPPDQYNPDLAPSLVSIIDKMMAKRLDQRYQTMNEVIKDIESFQGGATISYKIKKKKKFPVKRVAAAILIAFASVVGIFMWKVGQISGEERQATAIYNEAEDIWQDGVGILDDAYAKVQEALALYADLEVASNLKIEIEMERSYRAAMDPARKAFEKKDWSVAKDSLRRAAGFKRTEEVDEKLAIAVFEEKFEQGVDEAGRGLYGPAIATFTDALKLPKTPDQEQRADAAMKTAVVSLNNQNFDTYIKAARVALSKAQLEDARKSLVEAVKIFPNREEVTTLETDINARAKTIRVEREFREAFLNGANSLGNQDYASAITFFEDCQDHLNKAPTLKEPLAEEIADLERKLRTANYGLQMEDGRKAEEKVGKSWKTSMRHYKAALEFATDPEKRNTNRSIYNLGLKAAEEAWEIKDLDEANLALDDALNARPGDEDATALKTEVKRFSLTPEGMVYIPGGRFNAGTQHEDLTKKNPLRVRTVVKPYYMDDNEVTNRQFKEFIDDGGYEKEEFWDKKGWAERDRFKVTDKSAHGPKAWPTAGQYGGYHDNPVLGVTWYEATAYARWAGKRLPSDDEWEFAAGYDPVTRKKRDFPWGSEWNNRLGNFAAREAVSVARFKSQDVSPWGCYNMGGNAMEWTDTWDPKKKSTKPGSLRGGSFMTANTSLHAMTTNVRSSRSLSRNPAVGFRCAQDVE
ncbi:MAG: SUMF1/EgtB/PvdO family nonheme iron enzyme [Planctomycetota bacterium]|nr:SUMF1/EgtB/PvdO family nonheme iron enzyme [Planctomycetota bacterium]